MGYFFYKTFKLGIYKTLKLCYYKYIIRERGKNKMKKLNLEKLNDNLDVLKQRLKRYNDRLHLVGGSICFMSSDYDDRWVSVEGIFNERPFISSNERALWREWESIPHELVLDILKDWQKEFGEIEEIEDATDKKVNVSHIPDLEINQLRLNIFNELCLVVSYGNRGDCLRVWNLVRGRYESVEGRSFVNYYYKHDEWKMYLPKLVFKNVNESPFVELPE